MLQNPVLACAYLPLHNKVLDFDSIPSSHTTTHQLTLLILVKINQQGKKTQTKQKQNTQKKNKPKTNKNKPRAAK